MDIDLSGFGMPEMVVMAILGVALVLFGYRIKKVAFFVIWFILGYNLMGLLMPIITTNAPVIAESSLYQILLPIAGGLLLAMMGFSIEKLCVGGAAFALVMMVVVQYFGTEMQTLAIGGVIAVIVAGAAVMMMKPATIVVTSAVGAYALTIATLAIFPNINRETYYFPILIGATLVGTVFQFLTTKRAD